MKQIDGLERLFHRESRNPGNAAAADLLLRDLRHCRCLIFGQEQDEAVLLAELPLQQGSMQYEAFDQRIDMVFEGEIVRDDCVPLTYCLKGESLSIGGRCSLLPQVCGVDWYLGQGYSGKAGDGARLKYHIKLKDVLRRL